MADTGSTPVPARPRRRRAPLAIGVALVAILAVVVTGVAVAAVSRPNPRTVPDTASLAGPLAEQTLEWEECEFQEEIPNAAPPEDTDVSNLECATVEVPRDWLAPDPGSTWDIRISQAKNIDAGDPDYRTTVIAHPGGPVTPGLSYSAVVQGSLPELRETTNFVSFDQRGLGQSSHAPCDYEYVHDPADDGTAIARAIGESCSKDPDVVTMTTEQTAYDMDFIRHLLGLDKVTFFGASYGTWVGAWFGSLFADNVDRMVLDSAVDFTQPSIQTNYEQAYAGRDRQFRLHLMNYLARNDAAYGLGTDPRAIWQRYFAATESADASLAAALAWTTSGLTLAFSTALGYERAGELVASAVAVGEAEAAGGADASSDAPTDASVGALALAGRMIDGITGFDADRREAAKAALPATLQLYSPPAAQPGEKVQAEFDSLIEYTKCTDGEWAQGEEYWRGFVDRTSAEAPFSAQLLTVTVPICAFWPSGVTLPTPPVYFPETIVLQSELDAQTPYEQGRAAGLGLPNTSLIAIDNESAHGVFPYGTKQVDGPVIEFLRGGERPAPITIAEGKPIAPEQTTYETWGELPDDAVHRVDTPRFTDPFAEAVR